MSTKKLKKIEEIYHAITEIEPDKRESFLEKRCGDDLELRREIESLLRYSPSAKSFLETPPESLAAEMFADREDSNLIGKKINQYEILSLLGKGGMGAVYLAEDTKLDRKVALKFLPSEFAEDSDRMSRFVREAKSASALNHPNIITIYEIAESEETHFIATEFINGKTLNEYAKDSPFNYSSALEIAIQVVSALDVAHSSGIVHRDIKPDNVMIRTDGFVKILDFGIAKLVERRYRDAETRRPVEEVNSLSSPSLHLPIIPTSGTLPGVIVGTPNYMSPEQAGCKNIDHQTDIFSFGIVFYEMLSGKLPFKGNTAMDMIGAIIHLQPLPINKLLPDLPIEIVKIVDKALRKDLNKRYQTSRELLSDLKVAKREWEFKSRMEGISTSAVKTPLTDPISGIRVSPKTGAEIYGSRSTLTVSSDHDESGTPTFNLESRAAYSEQENIVDGHAPSTNTPPHLLPPNNLSGEFMPIFGRESEIAEILTLLSDRDVRLVTITGIGGTGKTHLAEKIMHRLLPEFLDGVFCIRLASIDDPQLLLPVIAQTLGVVQEGGRSLIECLISHIEGKKMLFLLDNFEQIVEGSPMIVELLQELGNIKILVTSRLRLNLSLEREFTLRPLGIPTEDHFTVVELGKFPAVELFVKTAKAAKHNFSLTEKNANSIAEICRRLDGLPLAIELAAARVKLFAPTAILNRLGNSLDLLTGGAKDLPERQQTIRGAIAWSYDLLEDDEKKLFRRLSVFRDGFNLEGAEFVGSAESKYEAKDAATSISSDNSDSPLILDLMSSLVDKSLLIQREQADGEPQFRMLVVVREFAFEKLADSGEAEKLKRRHAEFYLELAEKAGPELKGQNAAEWLDRLEQEHDNLRVALEWSLGNEPEKALRIVAAVHKFWARRGYLAEGSKWIKNVLAIDDAALDANLRATAYSGIGYLSRMQGDLAAAESFIDEGLRLSRETGDEQLISIALGDLGIVKLLQGDLDKAKELVEKSLAIAREIDDRTHIAFMLNNLGEIARQQNDFHAAREFYEESLSISRLESLGSFITVASLNIASVSCLTGDHPAARSYALEALKISEELGDTIGAGNALDTLAAAVGKTEDAARLFGAAQTVYESTGCELAPVDKKFKDDYIAQIKEAIGETAFRKAFENGRAIEMKRAIKMARQISSDLTYKTRNINKTGSGTQSLTADDKSEMQTAEVASVNTLRSISSRPNNFFSLTITKGVYLAVFLVIVLAAGTFFSMRFFTPKKWAIRSIAVLPFVNIGGNKDLEYLSDGLTENLIRSLATLPEISVKARGSVFTYKGKNRSAKSIGKELGVDAVLLGRMLQNGENFKLELELVETSSQDVIWSKIYERNTNNIPTLQGEIARNVSDQLRLKITTSERAAITKTQTTNAEAERLYMKGRFFWNKRNIKDFETSIGYFNQAIEKDPNYASAYSELSKVYALMPLYGKLSPKKYIPLAKNAALKALELDPNLSEAHTSLAYLLNTYDFNWKAAEREYKTAIALSPNNSTAHQWYSEHLAFQGKMDEALKEISIALELDPFSLVINRMKGNILGFAERHNEAILQLTKTEELYPDNALVKFNIGDSYAAKGMQDKAIEQYIAALKLDGTGADEINKLTTAYKTDGWKGFWLVYLGGLLAEREKHLDEGGGAFINSESIAYAYAATGNKDKAIEFLNMAYEERDPELITIKMSGVYDILIDDPRYKTLIKKIGLPE